MPETSLLNLLRDRFAAAIAQVTNTPVDAVDPQVRASGDPKFGDYQCNAAMQLARQLGAKPREVAERIAAAVDLAGIAGPLEVAGPGFLNIRLDEGFLAAQLGEIPTPSDAVEQPEPARPPEQLGIRRAATPVRVVIDYSSPNIAKTMHVGHIRSSVIGDVFVRVLTLAGHEVIRQNHVGDWGTQFGMLIAWYRENLIPSHADSDDPLGAIESDYRAAQARFKDDPEFAAIARKAVGELQSGDAEARRIWNALCDLSRDTFVETYQRLGVLLTDADVRGESFYNDRLAAVVQDLERILSNGPKNAAGDDGPKADFRLDRGARCVFLYDGQGEPAYRNADGEELPLIVQKSDGAYLYASTDLAAVRFRTGELGGQRLIYVTDARQKLHFQMMFHAARAAGFAPPETRFEHVTFGSILGEDRKPLKTRSGENIRLTELLNEAEQRALDLLKQRAADKREDDASPNLSEDEMREVARRVGVASIKYADLRGERTTDYVFSWEKLISFQGNTAPYLMYAYARIRSIYRKAAEQLSAADVYAADLSPALATAEERALALRLARLRETVESVASDLMPHVLCSYLYDLAADFMRFYEACPVLKAETDAQRRARLRLCDLTARTLRLGLWLLGIEAIERM